MKDNGERLVVTTFWWVLQIIPQIVGRIPVYMVKNEISFAFQVCIKVRESGIPCRCIYQLSGLNPKSA